MSPLATSRVIPAGFQAHHRPYALGSMTVGVVFTRAGDGPGVFDPATGDTAGPPRVDVAATIARIQPLPPSARARPYVQGDQVITLHSSLVEIPLDTPVILVDDVMEVTSIDGNADPDLLGTDYRIRDLMGASTAWSRNLMAEQNLG